jgi:hypothetical protein
LADVSAARVWDFEYLSGDQEENQSLAEGM